jgi:hypothetical protein
VWNFKEILKLTEFRTSALAVRSSTIRKFLTTLIHFSNNTHSDLPSYLLLRADLFRVGAVAALLMTSTWSAAFQFQTLLQVFVIDALRSIVQYVYAGILQMVFRRTVRFRELEIMVPEKAVLKHRVIIYVLLLLLLLLL